MFLVALFACGGPAQTDGPGESSSDGGSAPTTGDDDGSGPSDDASDPDDDTGSDVGTTEGGDTTAADTSGSSSESSGGSDPCATALGSGDEPIFERPPGMFVLQNQAGFVGLSGTITEGPRLEFHTEAERTGMCRLLTFEATTCTPMCEFGTVCLDGECVTGPPFVSAGAVTLDGVEGGPFSVSEDQFHNYYWDSFMAELTMPTLDAAGDVVDPFTLSVCPVDAPTPSDDWSAQMAARAPGESVTLAWSDPVDTARIYLRMTTGIGTHGGISPVEVECEGPDVGMLELPGAYLDALYETGWSCGECGGNDLFRYHADQTDGADPAVQLRVTGSAPFYFIP